MKKMLLEHFNIHQNIIWVIDSLNEFINDRPNKIFFFFNKIEFNKKATSVGCMNVHKLKLTYITWHTHLYKHTYLLSGPLHLCCVCFSELLKRQKTKSRQKRKESACDPSLFPFSFLLFHLFLFFSWPGKWADRVTLFSCFILLRPVGFYIYSPRAPLLLPPPFISFAVFFSRKAIFLSSDLISFWAVTYTGLGNVVGQ